MLLTTPRGPHREPTVLDSMDTASAPLTLWDTTATLPSVLWVVPAFTPPVSPTATGPHRVLASVKLMPKPLVLVPVDSSVSPVPASPNLASTTMESALSPTQ